MKTVQLLIAAAVTTVFNLQIVNAKSWRVNNNATGTYGESLGGNAIFPVFKQLNDADTSRLVNGGDTLYVEGSGGLYNAAAIDKRLTIIGPGYFLTENPKASSDGANARVYDIRFNAGSEGTKIRGLILADGVYSAGINVSDITIENCCIIGKIYVVNNISNISIIANYFPSSGSTRSVISPNSSQGFASNFIFNNNICQRALDLSFGTTIYTATECNNNVFDYNSTNSTNHLALKLNANSFYNNILKNAEDSVFINNGTTDNIDYNISASQTKQFGTSKHNIVVQDFSTLFINSNSSDGKYQLQPNSAGSNPGSDGTDRGAFGGQAVYDRYTLSGLAPIPVIYQVNTSGAAANNLPVNIGARTIK